MVFCFRYYIFKRVWYVFLFCGRHQCLFCPLHKGSPSCEVEVSLVVCQGSSTSLRASFFAGERKVLLCGFSSLTLAGAFERAFDGRRKTRKEGAREMRLWALGSIAIGAYHLRVVFCPFLFAFCAKRYSTCFGVCSACCAYRHDKPTALGCPQRRSTGALYC